MKILNYIPLILISLSTPLSQAFTVYNTLPVPQGSEIRFTVKKYGKKEKVTMVFNHRMQRRTANIIDGNYEIELELWVPDSKGGRERERNHCIYGYQFVSDTYKFNIVMGKTKAGDPCIMYANGLGQELHSVFNLLTRKS